MKQNWKPGTTIYPLPAVLVSCGSTPDEYNLLTVSWVGTICTNPPMTYISVRPERHSPAVSCGNSPPFCGRQTPVSGLPACVFRPLPQD